jgi:hypothetical protein
MYTKYRKRCTPVGMDGNSQLKKQTTENLELYEQYFKQLLKFLRALWEM